MATYVVDGDQYRIVDRRMREIKRQLDQEGGCPSDPVKIVAGLQYIIEGRFTTPTSYPLRVDRTLTRQQMIDVGNYNYVNPNITEKRFPVNGSGVIQLDAILVHLDVNISTLDADHRIDHMGLRTGDADETCALGAQYPELQRQFPIVGLGQVSDGDVVCLVGGAGGRILGLGDVRYDWFRAYRFLAFRKSQA